MSLRLSTAVSLLAICLPPICVSAQTVINGTTTNDTNTAATNLTSSGSYIINSGSTYQIASTTDSYGIRINSTNVTLSIQGTLVNGKLLSTDSDAAALRVTGASTNGILVNVGSVGNTAALVQSKGNDAIKFTGVGSSTTSPNILNNWGVVRSDGAVNTSGGSANTYQVSDAVTMGTNTTLNNYGTVSGSRHGLDGGAITGVTVNNYSGGTIVGRNGSGVGMDTTSAAASAVTVNNWGVIRGDYAGAGNIFDRANAASLNGDGDGVDIDGAATINNFSTGQILSTGAGGYDSGGRANNSEAISIGGGVIVNDGIIRGADRGIVVNNDSNVDRSGVAATTITNNSGATIEGQNGYAIRLENKLGDARDNDTITNAGTIIGNGSIPNPSGTVLRQDGLLDPNSTGTLDGVAYTGTGSGRFIQGDGSAIQMGEGDDVLTNTGTITGNTGRAINMEGGNDIVNFNAGTITGEINGGAGTDTLNLGASVSTASAIKSFENVNVASGSATLSGVVSGNTLTKGGTGTLVLANDNTYTGQTTVTAGGLRVDNASGSATGAGNVVVNSGAKLTGGGIIGGNVTLDGILDPGNIVGTLTVNGTVTWNGDITNAWQFDLSTGNASDRLLVGGDFTKGLGSDFVFDFKGGAVGGTFTLVGWNGTTNFTSTDFHYVNLGAGYTASFAISGNELQLTIAVVPEQAIYAAFFSAGVLAFAVWRRRASASGRKL
jgi:autotransporter-associated beta strand protein